MGSALVVMIIIVIPGVEVFGEVGPRATSSARPFPTSSNASERVDRLVGGLVCCDLQCEAGMFK